LIVDEVMTGFGRTGNHVRLRAGKCRSGPARSGERIDRRYLPLAATLTTEQIFDAFLGGVERTFYYGHSYTANQLGCAAALANLAIFRDECVLESLRSKIARLTELLEPLRRVAHVVDVRQCGFIAAVELSCDAAAVCLAARRHRLLTRPIGNVVVLMPPYCITDSQLQHAVAAIVAAIADVNTTS
jgi:adenosylmethionine-8-amino-7-oxononanoate aminotransferase